MIKHLPTTTAQSSQRSQRFQRLLSALSEPQFIDEHFLKLPFTQKQTANDLIELASWKVVEEILTEPDADFLFVRDGARAEQRPHDPVAAKKLHEQGYTLVIRKADETHPELELLANKFREWFRAKIDIHIYCTPANHHGFGWHYDAEDVFMIQTEGAKSYTLRKNTVNPWPVAENLPRDMHFQREIMPLWKCRLLPGDWLYVPNGYWHKAEAESPSISLAIGVMSTTALDVFDHLRKTMVESLLWRQRLPGISALTHHSANEAVENLESLFADLANDLSHSLRDPALLQDFLRERGIRLNAPWGSTEFPERPRERKPIPRKP